MRRLEKEFTDKGMLYKEIESFTIKGKTWRTYQRGSNPTDITLARIDVKPRGEIFGKVVPEREKFPSSEEWGSKAFDFCSSDALWEKVYEMEARL